MWPSQEDLLLVPTVPSVAVSDNSSIVGLRIWTLPSKESSTAAVSMASTLRPCCDSFFLEMEVASLNSRYAVAIEPEAINDMVASRTTDLLRGIAAAIETYQYASDRVLPCRSFGPRSNECRALLVPLFLETMPSEDPWGGELIVWSDGESYVVASAGATGSSVLTIKHYSRRRDSKV